MLVPGAAVGAVGVPVKLGEAIVARNAMSAVFVAIFNAFVVILAVFELTLVFKLVILLRFVVILAVLDAILVLFVSISAVFIVILSVLEAIFAVFVVTVAGNVEIVVELTPPILFTVGKSAVPPKSFVDLILPFKLAVASGVADPPTIDETNSVVAI